MRRTRGFPPARKGCRGSSCKPINETASSTEWSQRSTRRAIWRHPLRMSWPGRASRAAPSTSSSATRKTASWPAMTAARVCCLRGHHRPGRRGNVATAGPAGLRGVARDVCRARAAGPRVHGRSLGGRSCREPPLPRRAWWVRDPRRARHDGRRGRPPSSDHGDLRPGRGSSALIYEEIAAGRTSELPRLVDDLTRFSLAAFIGYRRAARDAAIEALCTGD